MSSLPKEELEKLENVSRERRVILNVGGVRHEVLRTTLDRLPDTRLGRLLHCNTYEELLKLCDGYSLSNNEYFFDRTSVNFYTILNFHQTGKLHLMNHSCPLSISEDLEYWGILDLHIQPCCQGKYFSQKTLDLDEIKRTDELYSQSKLVVFPKGRCLSQRKLMWNVCEHPDTNKWALAIQVISTLFIILSSMQLIISSMPQYQVKNDQGIYVEDPRIAVIEHICVAWFTLEFAIRLFAAPDKRAFFSNVLNMIDMIVILPYYILLLIKIVKPTWSSTSLENFFRVLRVFRVLKLSRHSPGMRALGITLRNSRKELGMLGLFFALVVLMYSSFVYFAEHDTPQTKFESIPEGFWWAAITMSTVGYGDMYPQSTLGKIIGGMCCISGVIVIALPIPIIVTNFTLFYESSRRRQDIIARMKQLEELQTQETHI